MAKKRLRMFFIMLLMLLLGSILTACTEKTTPYGKSPLTAPTETQLTITPATTTPNQFAEQLQITTTTVIPSGSFFYLWPTWIPEDLLLSPSDSYGDEHGFTLEFKKPYALMSIKGGPPAIKDWDLFHEDGKPITVRDHEGYYFGTGGGFGIQWQENGHPFYVGGPGMSFEDAAKIAESLEIIDLSTLQKRLEPDTRYEAVYLVQGQGVLSQDDLNAHPEVLVVHSLFEFRRHSQTKIALLIDKNAIDVLQGYSMEEEVFENDPVVLVGYADPMYSFHDVLQLDSKFGGPSEGYLYGPTKDPNLIEPGFSVWILPVGMQDRKDAMTTGFQKTPTVQNILDITNPLLEGKMPNGFEKCCPDR